MGVQAQRWLRYLETPVDAASLGVFRIVFGTLVAWDAYRFLAEGWVEEYFVAPKIHFPFFSFVQPWPSNIGTLGSPYFCSKTSDTRAKPSSKTTTI